LIQPESPQNKQSKDLELVKPIESIEDDTFSEPSGFDDSDFIQQQEIT
jgi:hypothetical protein